jgi:hypothetical protein
MFNFLKKFFEKETPETIDKEKLQEWFKDKVKDAETEL